MLGTGIFGLYLKNILLSHEVSDTYEGEEEAGGRRLARYSYRLPLMWSREIIHMLEGSGQVGLHGSYWVDPTTYDVVHLEVYADDIPPTLPITEAVTNIRYARTLVGNSMPVLLPESAEVRVAKFSGGINVNHMEFTHCRVFGSESTINFDETASAEQTPRFAVASVDDTLRTLPAGLEIPVKLRTRISGDMAVGSLIDGVVASNVSAKGKVAVTAGAPVRGRIRRLEHYKDPFPYFVVALEFAEVDVGGSGTAFTPSRWRSSLPPGWNKRCRSRARQRSGAWRAEAGRSGKAERRTGSTTCQEWPRSFARASSWTYRRASARCGGRNN